MRIPCAILGVSLFALSQSAHAGFFDKIIPKIGNPGTSIGKSVDEINKSPKTLDEIGKQIGQPTVEQAPTDPCRINPKLPQCDLFKEGGR